MKKLLSVLLTLSMLAITPFAHASSCANGTLLKALNLVPDGISVSDESRLTYATLEYTTSVLSNGAAISDEGATDTDSKVTFTAVRDAISKAISNGTVLTGSQLGSLTDGVNIINTTAISNKEFFKMVENALDISLPKVTYKESEITGELTESIDTTDKESVLASRFDVSVYEGTMTEAVQSENSAKVIITKNVNDDNPAKADLGKEYSFNALSTVNLYNYENAPIRIWVADENIICIQLQKDITITYNYIYSINGDSNKGDTFAPPYFTNMYLYDVKKKYTFDSSFTMKFDSVYTAEPVDIIDNFAKVILKDGKVLFMEAWSLQEGGIVESLSDETLTYTYGSVAHKRIEDVDTYDTKILFMDDRSTDFTELKAGTYFDYYADEVTGTLIVVANEKVITGTFDSISDDTIHISGNEYAARDVIYYNTTGNLYSKDTDPSKLLNQLVDVYFTYEGYAVYVRASQGKSVDDGSFLGAVMSYVDKDKRDDDGNADRDKLTLFLLNDTFDKQSYDVAKRCTFEDGLSVSELIYNQMDKYGDGIYKFKLNSLGEICNISKPIELTGVDAHLMTANYRPAGENVVYMLAPLTGTKKDGTTTTYTSVIYLDNDTRFIGLSSDGTYFRAAETTFGNIYKHRAPNGGIKIHYFAEEEYNTHNLTIVMAGDLTALTPNLYDQGLITSINKVINKYNEEVCYEVKLIGSEGTLKRYVTLEDGANLKQYTYIEYNGSIIANDGYIEILSTNDLSGDFSTWNPTFSGYQGPFFGTCEHVDGQLLFLADGNAATIHKTECFVILDHGVDEKNDRFELITKDDILPGYNVMYNAGDSVKMLMVEEVK